MRCSGCGGPYSEVSGHIWTPQIRLCGACAKHWLDWLKRHTRSKWGGLRFYEHTETSRNKTGE
jgi:hypothetical protein